MKRIISLVLVTMIMSALVLADALPAFAAPPSFNASCYYTNIGSGTFTSVPQEYKDVNAFYRDCQDSGGTASREIAPNPGPPTQ